MLILPRLQRGGGSKCQTIALRRRDRLAAVALPSTAPRNLPPQERTRPPERPQPGQAPHSARLLEAGGPSRAPKKQHQAPEPALRLEPLLPERQGPRRASPRLPGREALRPASLPPPGREALRPASPRLPGREALRPASPRPPGRGPPRAPLLAK